jgi:hypothetical protein
MSPADVTPDHALMSNILPHLAFQVRLYLQPAEWVRVLRFDSWEWRRGCVELRKVAAGSDQVLEGR